MRDLHLPSVNKYGVKTLHAILTEHCSDMNGINYVKIITVTFHTAALHPKMVLFQNMSGNFKMTDLPAAFSK